MLRHEHEAPAFWCGSLHLRVAWPDSSGVDSRFGRGEEYWSTLEPDGSRIGEASIQLSDKDKETK